MCEGLLFPETFNEDLDSCERRQNRRSARTCDNCWEKKEGQVKMFSFRKPLICVMVLSVLTDLSFHSLFGDADGRLSVRLQSSARLPFFPNDVPVVEENKRHIILTGYK